LAEHLDVDILCFQEVTRRSDAAALGDYVSQDAIDAVTDDFPYSFFAPLSVIRNFRLKNFHKQANFNVDFGGFMDFGYYIKSRLPISGGTNVLSLTI